MLKLIKLEIEKNNLKLYMFGILLIFIFTTLVGVLLNATPIIEPNDQAAKIFSTLDGLIPMITVISLNGFVILSSVMYAKIVIEEYTGTKNVLLFTYPQKRSEIILAKFLLIFIFTSISMIITNVSSITIVIIIGNITGLLYETISIDSTLNVIGITVIFSILTNLISLISLKIGFSLKSIIWTIVVAIILTSPVGNIVMILQENTLKFTSISSIFLIIGCSILFLDLLKKVNEMECI